MGGGPRDFEVSDAIDVLRRAGITPMLLLAVEAWEANRATRRLMAALDSVQLHKVPSQKGHESC